MPVLDARALRRDPKGLAFLREVLRREGPVQGGVQREIRRLALRVARRKSEKVAEKRAEQPSSV
jgi:hypothetical protein